MVGTKLEFSTAYYPQTDCLDERMIQTVEEIIRRFCAHGMEYKDLEGYTHDWVTLLPAVQLAHNTSQNSTTGKSPSLVEKGWNPLFPVDHLNKNLITIHPTAKDFHYLWKRACDKAGNCIVEAKEYNKQRYYKTLMEPDFKERDQFGGWTHRGLLQEKLSIPSESGQTILPERRGQVLLQKEDNTPPDIVEVEYLAGPVKKIIKARKIRLNLKDQR
ncbi:hypothetical protein O181_107176 [Austropuccinia psidii MF-1]|uniref:Integrase catalytic domain-containing protein n=1 Tax=Austropuccinia psidii MF-1 TaxID=1389203 RepID=A0A9Q3JSU8_9BASI|nr:hypothetical protein [Austropuccinia psidii MF-1]